MGDFFKGRRRKTGLVTLVMACVLMVAWLRSHVLPHPDRVELHGDQVELFGIEVVSFHGYLLLFDDNGWEQIPVCLASGETIIEERHRPSAQVPYLLLVWPLTLLSAWLIVGKRRQKPKLVTSSIVNSN